MIEVKKMYEQQGFIDLGKIKFIAMRKVCPHNSSLYVNIPKKLSELEDIYKDDNMGVFLDPVK